MTFKDRAFCDSDCSNIFCERNFSQDQKYAADKWWGKPGAPILFDPSFLKDCHEYMPPRAFKG
jgi:hypothetical protein